MRLDEVVATDVLPIRHFSATDLSDVVVLAGANGVGKSRLLEGLVSLFRNPTGYKQIRARLSATSEAEATIWGRRQLDTSNQEDCQALLRLLQQARKRSSWTSSVLQFESDRSIQQIQPYTFSWDYSDPFAESTGWDVTFGGLRTRFQDTLHSLFRKVRSHREAIARSAEDLRKQGAATMALNWPDPLEGFKAAFSQLLAPKRLLDPNPQQQQLEYELEDKRFPISSLSSGEREVVNVVFDFLLRNPSDCIILFDEPELHLHPELSYRLLETLRAAGRGNQFVFSTHSPDIITASLDQSVIFVGPATPERSNQAVRVMPDDDTHLALRLLGQSIGIVALGKRIVLIEGNDSSLDKQTYGSILRNRFPTLVLVPAGGRGLITAFDQLLGGVLDRSIWGVQFFMLCDRDAVPITAGQSGLEERSRRRLRLLPRYHLENYFLDPTVLAAVFQDLEPPDSWLRDEKAIAGKLRDIATQHASTAVALTVAAELRAQVGNVDLMPKGVHNVSLDELIALFVAPCREEVGRVTRQLDPSRVETHVRTANDLVRGALEASDDRWISVIPGRPIFNSFANISKLGSTRLRQAYIQQAGRTGATATCFQDVLDIFSGFAG
ncbi:MAG: ATP-binding protein [Gemmatimonadales bacterium]|nr:ATP-binding protein [Gemmatimonadales bacterium]